MNGSTENTAHGASERPSREERMVDLATARRMVPLVRHIVADLLQQGGRLQELKPEQERLERKRRSLTWPERKRRYHLQEEVEGVERALQGTTAELESLGVRLLDPVVGRVGFPTLVNDHRAFFSWRPGEDGLHFWHFAGETVRRQIPPTWIKAAQTNLTNKP